jgi:hypothetical protein
VRAPISSSITGRVLIRFDSYIWNTAQNATTYVQLGFGASRLHSLAETED